MEITQVSVSGWIDKQNVVSPDNRILFSLKKEGNSGTSLVVQWVRLCAPNAGAPGSIPGQGTRFCMHATTKSSRAATKSPHAAMKILCAAQLRPVGSKINIII